jgi:hypothetical protein
MVYRSRERRGRATAGWPDGRVCARYNRGYLFSHFNIFVTYLLGLVLNNSMDLTEEEEMLRTVAMALLGLQLLLMLYLVKVSRRAPPARMAALEPAARRPELAPDSSPASSCPGNAASPFI